MANATAISWTDLTWNPVHGCSKVSPGCAHCYAETLSRRYHQTPKPWTPGNAAENVTVKPHKLREPLSNARAWRGLGTAAAAAGKTDGKLVFVNSMSDLFHEEVPADFILDVFRVMGAASRHTFQVLTKRPERMLEVLPWVSVQLQREGAAPLGPVWKHVWLGVSIENRRYVRRADLLRQTPAAVRFISAEPLLGPLVHDGEGMTFVPPGSWDEAVPVWRDGYGGPGLDLTGISWVIVGGESGPRHRPMQRGWARDLRDACLATRERCDVCWGGGFRREFDPPEPCERCGGDGFTGTAYFLKQLGGPRPGGEALLDGREWREFPQVGAR